MVVPLIGLINGYLLVDSLCIFSSIDNLLRGASSQAVVNANLMCGYEENLGIPIFAYVP